MILTLQIISFLLYRLFFETYTLIGNTDLKNVIVPPLLMHRGGIANSIDQRYQPAVGQVYPSELYLWS